MASELTEGTYAILSVGSQMAMDVKGGSDLSGANVQQWTYSASDAQLWTITVPEDSDGWQIICALTNECLSAASISAGANILQKDDDDSDLQRWSIIADNNTYVYNNKTYDTYFLKTQSNDSLYAEVQGSSTSAGANIRLNTASNGNNQRWIFIPIKVLKENGTYNILLAADPKMCIDIASGSTANGANTQVWTKNDSLAQTFRIHRHDQSNTVGIISVKSDKALDVKAGKAVSGTTVQQWTSNLTAAQTWLPIQSGSKKIEGINYPTYEIRLEGGSGLCMDCAGGGTKAKTDIRIWTRNNTKGQRFIFFPTEVPADDLIAPDSVLPDKFPRVGEGEVRVYGLHFKSTYSSFQARYCVREYKKDGTKVSDKDTWKNVRNDSDSRDGWGDVWSKTITGNPAIGDISIPFDKTYTLASGENKNDVIKMEVVFEIRAFDENHGSGYIAHGTVKQSSVWILQRPNITVTDMAILLDKTNNDFGIVTTISDSLGQGCQRLRGRLLGEDGLAISEWVSTSEMSVKHMTSGTLRRLPIEGEKITFEYSMLTVDGLMENGTYIKNNFTYGTSPGFSPMPTATILQDDSECALITSEAHNIDFCIMTIPDIDGTKLVNCELKTIDEITGNKIWKCVPPLNTNSTITIIGSNDESNFGLASVNVLVESHLFIWNWTTFGTTDPYNDSAAIIVNSETIPQQTRGFTVDMKFNTPSGRLFPVGFASSIIGLDLSVEGVTLDRSANYQALYNLPSNISLENLYRLVRLGGKGIHPIYRTPYGDWYYVGIESLNISNKDLGRIAVSVTQRALEE